MNVSSAPFLFFLKDYGIKTETDRSNRLGQSTGHAGCGNPLVHRHLEGYGNLHSPRREHRGAAVGRDAGERCLLQAQPVGVARGSGGQRLQQRPAPGAILEQVPTAGRKVKSGREIILTVNTEKRPTTALPDIADNSSLREAQAKLTAIGFKLGPVEYVNGDRDWVYGVKCRDRNIYAGEQAPLDVPLVLQVGRGVSDLEELVEEDGEEEEFVEEEIIAPDGTD